MQQLRGEGLGAGRVPPGQLGEIHLRHVDVVEIAAVELTQFVQRPAVAEVLAAPEDELVQQALLCLVLDRRGRAAGSGSVSSDQPSRSVVFRR